MSEKTIYIEHCWLDCDPGHDDTFAILMASFSDKIKLIGMSTVSGNKTIEKVAKNTVLTVLNLFGQVKQEQINTDSSHKLTLNESLTRGGMNCPLLKRCSKPLLRPVTRSQNVHGESGMDTLVPVQLPTIPSHALEYVEKINNQGENFTTLMYKHLRESEKPVTIIATGPLTNVALLLINHPDVSQYIGKIVLMGGAVGTGNANPVAEFNIHTDADAAAYVFESDIPFYIVPLEVKRTACVNSDLLRDVRAIGSNLSNILIEFLLFFDSTMKSIFSLAAAIHDPCAVASVIDPDMFE
jgi:pyrimidine-specific ribonucleoside hydrolase